MDSDKRITKSNELIKASYRLSLTEMQIILYSVSLINPTSKNFPSELDIKISEFAEAFNKNTKTVYRDIKTSIFNNFWERDVKFNNNSGGQVKIRWVSKIEYYENIGRILIGFSEHVRPYLHDLSKSFTSYRIKEVIDLKSVHSIRLYENFIMEINKSQSEICDVILSVESIKSRLDLSDKYSQYFSLKERVIKKAKKEINEYSDICFDFEEIKKGRGKGVEAIKFTIQKKNDATAIKKQKQDLDFDTTDDEGFNTDTSPLSDTELHYLMRKNDIKVRMFSYRVAEKVACQLIRTYSFEQIEKALNYVDKAIKKGKDIKNKPAYLVNAIKEGY